MSNAKHTPGPWTAITPEKGDDYISCGVYRVLDVSIGSCAISLDEHVANVKLAAAAPDMAEALKDLLGRVPEADEDGFHGRTDNREAKDKARAALAKAGVK